MTLFDSLAESIDTNVVDKPVDWCPNEIQWSNELVGMSGLIKSLGEAVELS